MSIAARVRPDPMWHQQVEPNDDLNDACVERPVVSCLVRLATNSGSPKYIRLDLVLCGYTEAMEPNRAAALIAAARLTAGLTQTRLADLAGTTQPTISAYERGAKVPDLATLERILDAAGFELRMSLAPTDDHDRSLERYERTLPAASRRGFNVQQKKRKVARASGHG